MHHIHQQSYLKRAQKYLSDLKYEQAEILKVEVILPMSLNVKVELQQQKKIHIHNYILQQ